MTYFGGKNGSGVYQKIINNIPPHDTYLELFFGSGAVMRLKKPARLNIACDLHLDNLVHFTSKLDIRVRDLIVINGDAISYLRDPRQLNAHTRSRDLGFVFCYLDPPYPFETRRSQAAGYQYEFGEMRQHEELLKIILQNTRFMIAISGYRCELYDDMLKDWRRVDYQTRTRQETVIESLWMNYPEPFELHDYRYLGENYRERERIKRKQKRWDARLSRMPALERYALMQVIEHHRK